jgi:hypothetical protein
VWLSRFSDVAPTNKPTVFQTGTYARDPTDRAARGGARFELPEASSKNVISFIEQCRHNVEQYATVLRGTPTGASSSSSNKQRPVP